MHGPIGLPAFLMGGSDDRSPIHSVAGAQVLLGADDGRETGPESDAVKRSWHNAALETCFRYQPAQPTTHYMLLHRDDATRLAACPEHGL